MVGPVVDDFSFDLTSIHQVDLLDNKVDIHSSAFMGRADQIYMAGEHLYLFATGLNWFSWDPRLKDNDLQGASRVVKF
jgi:hypothetical protein